MDPRIVELLSRLGEVDDGQLGDLEDILVAQLEDAAESKDVDTARSLGEAIDNVRKERKTREELARQREAEIAEIMGRVHAHAETQPDEGGDGGQGAGDDDGNEDEDQSADGERQPASTQASAGGGAGAKSDRPLPKIADLVRARPSQAASVAASTRRSADRQVGTTTVIAASDVPGISAGAEIPDRATLRKAMVERWSASSGSRTTGRLPVAKIQMNYPEDRILRSGDEEGNFDKIQRLVSPPALLASGGICAPPAGFYDTNTLATAARPLRDSLPVFQATRGGIRFIPSLSVSDVGGAIGVITEAEDTAGGAGGTKPCLVITCESPDEVTVQAISRCLQFGNFNARTHPEYVSHIGDLTLAAHARTAEQQLWEGMCSAATGVTADDDLGAWRDLYGVIARTVASFRSRHRMGLEATLRVDIPGWVATMLSVDLVRQTPGDNTIEGAARSRFETALRGINAVVTWTLEGGVTNPQIWGAQAAGPVAGWPADIELLVYPEGTYLFLDGGTLDLGIVRDSTLNVTNDFQTFAESFEAVAFLGPEALCVTAQNVCPSGLSAGSDDTPGCVQGS